MRGWHTLCLGLALAGPGCTGTAGTTDAGDADAHAKAQDRLGRLEAWWNAFHQKQSQIQDRLPPILARFESRDPRQWERAKQAIESDPLLNQALNPETRDPQGRAESLLLWATDRGSRGEEARKHLVFLGRAYTAARGFDSPDPRDWSRARELLQALGPRGEDSAAITIILRLQPLELPAGVMRRLQQELAALGAGGLRVIRVALERANFSVVERLLPALTEIGEPAAAMLVELCDHEREDVVRIALRGLAVAPHASAAPRLIRFLEPDQSWRARSMALLALAETPAPEAGLAILKACGDDDPSVAKFAGQAAQRFYRKSRNPNAVRVLLKLLEKPGEEYRGARRSALDALRAVTELPRGQRADFDAWLQRHKDD